MLIEVKRFEFKDTHTIGKLYIDGVYECYTLEDVVRNGSNTTTRTVNITSALNATIQAPASVVSGTSTVSMLFLTV